MKSVDQYRIAQFNDTHDVTEDAQFRQLVEEVGELAEAYNREVGDEGVGEELADVIFVARSLAELREINVTAMVSDVIDENAQKDTSKDGQKVTKDHLVPAWSVVSDDDVDVEDSAVRGKWGVTDDE